MTDPITESVARALRDEICKNIGRDPKSYALEKFVPEAIEIQRAHLAALERAGWRVVRITATDEAIDEMRTTGPHVVAPAKLPGAE